MDLSHKKLSIRNKIIYIIIFCSLFFIIAFYFISSFFLLKNFIKLENDQVIRNIHRVEVYFYNTIENQSIKLKDWAYWDDTYKFVEDKNKEYIDSNLTNESLSSLGINLIVFINAKDEIVFSKFINTDSGIDLPQDNILAFIKENITSIKEISEKNKINDIINLPEGKMIISVDQILKSDQSGITHGTIIFGSFVNDKLVEKTSSVVGFSTIFYPYNAYSDVGDLVLAKSNLSKNNDYYIHIMNNNIIHGYLYLKDIFDEPSYIVRVELPRDIYTQGKDVIFLLTIIMFFAVLLLDFLIAFLLEKFIIKRLIRLGDNVVEISKNNDFSKNLDEDVNDEIGWISVSINLMLNKFREMGNNEKKIDEEQKLIAENDKIHFEEIDKLNKLMMGREIKMIELKKEILKLKGEEVDK